MGRTPWEILTGQAKPPYRGGHTFLARPERGLLAWEALGEDNRPPYMTFEERMWDWSTAVRTFPVEAHRELVLVALRAAHELDRDKLALALQVAPEQIKPALPARVRMKLGFEHGFETIVTDEDVMRFVDVRVTWMRGATITMGTRVITARVQPERLLEISDATVGDFAAEPVPLDQPEHLPFPPLTPEEARIALRDVAQRVTFPIWVPASVLRSGKTLFGASWSAGLGSPVTTLDRATLMVDVAGGWSVYLDESPGRAHHARARKEWPRLLEAGLDSPRLTNVDFVERDGVGITLVAHEKFPGDLRRIADSLVKFELD
jgi:hypothetical protein